jgi:hypothetical protein
MSRRTFKERNSNRINFMIQQEIIDDQLRREQEQAEIRLQNELDALAIVERATHKAFASIENKVSDCGEVGA